MLKEFCEFIEDKTSFVVGTTLQVGHRPQSAPDRCNAVLETVGGETFPEDPSRVDIVFQILSRSERGGTASIWQARADAWEIFKALTGDTAGVIRSAQWTLPVVDDSYVAMVIEAISAPAYIGQDEQGRFEYSTNYLVKIRDA